MTRAEALEFKQRWQFINDFIAEEIRTTKPEVRFQQLRTMMATAARVARSDSATDAVAQVRQRWLRLKKQMHAPS